MFTARTFRAVGPGTGRWGAAAVRVGTSGRPLSPTGRISTPLGWVVGARTSDRGRCPFSAGGSGRVAAGAGPGARRRCPHLPIAAARAARRAKTRSWEAAISRRADFRSLPDSLSRYS